MSEGRPEASMWAASPRTVKIEASLFFLIGACITLYMSVEHIFLLAPNATIGNPDENMTKTVTVAAFAVGAVLGAIAVSLMLVLTSCE